MIEQIFIKKAFDLDLPAVAKRPDPDVAAEETMSPDPVPLASLELDIDGVEEGAGLEAGENKSQIKVFC